MPFFCVEGPTLRRLRGSGGMGRKDIGNAPDRGAENVDRMLLL
jgi:hypothetical protein